MPKQELSNKLYLWTRQPKKYAKILVISAHGSIDSSLPDFQNNYATLSFDALHGDEAASGGGLARFAYPHAAKEIVKIGSKCYDYTLNKFQGKHSGKEGGGESYEHIEQAMKTPENANKFLFSILREFGDKPLPPLSGQRVAMPFDVLTVRNKSGNAVLLSDALGRVATVNKYAVVVCSFCRVVV
ncbi:MAG TPA: hypothetical protein VFM46_14420 [Pseudomonadales bacterium]|nr:hypothetical protein [Pseudomonadales bacterium]